MVGARAVHGRGGRLILGPGPDTAFVLAQSVGGGRGRGVRAAVGVAAVVLVHTVAGLSVLFEVSRVAYDVVRRALAAYLGTLAVASGTARAVVDRPGVRTWLRRSSGGTMLALGVVVALGDP